MTLVPPLDSEHLNRLLNQSWDALNNEQNPIKLELVIVEMDEAIEHIRQQGPESQVLVWQERRDDLAKRRQRFIGQWAD